MNENIIKKWKKQIITYVVDNIEVFIMDGIMRYVENKCKHKNYTINNLSTLDYYNNGNIKSFSWAPSYIVEYDKYSGEIIQKYELF